MDEPQALLKIWMATTSVAYGYDNSENILTDGTNLEQNDYYPFGLRTTRKQTYITLSQSLASATAPGYLYNGKEKQEFIHNTASLLNAAGSATYTSNYIDYGARFYNPVTLRWTTQDPLAEKYMGYSPYNYCANSPIGSIDVNGLFAGDYYKSTGEWVGSDGINDDKVYLYTHSEYDQSGKETLKGNELACLHREFRSKAATVYGESSAYAVNKMTSELKNEMYAIVYIKIVNNVKAAAYGSTSIKAKEYLALTPKEINYSIFKTTANGAVINALTKGEYPSNGATKYMKTIFWKDLTLNR